MKKENVTDGNSKIVLIKIPYGFKTEILGLWVEGILYVYEGEHVLINPKYMYSIAMDEFELNQVRKLMVENYRKRTTNKEY